MFFARNFLKSSVSEGVAYLFIRVFKNLYHAFRLFQFFDYIVKLNNLLAQFCNLIPQHN